MLKTGMKKHRIFALATIDVRAAIFSASRKPTTTTIGAMIKTFFGVFSPMAMTAAMKAMTATMGQTKMATRAEV